MTEEIKPALTPEEWHNERKVDPVSESAVYLDRQADGTVYFVVRSHDTWHGEPYTGAVVLTQQRAAAIAALALYGQPFGFSHEDVNLCRNFAIMYAGVRPEVAPLFESLAVRIAALLPPEP